MKQLTRKAVIIIALVSLIILGVVPQALAANYKVVGKANGLTIESLAKNQGTGNLNPGDTKDSKLKLTNTSKCDVKVWIKTNVTGNRPGPNGGDLAEVLALLIKNGEKVITNDSFEDAAEKEYVLIGTMKPGEVIYLDFAVTLPGPETGNAYQGSSIDANWTFTTESKCDDGGDGGDGGGGNDPQKPDDPDDREELEIPDGPAPTDPSDPTDPTLPPEEIEVPEPGIIIEEVSIPSGGLLKMPKTGELPPFLFYGIGSVVVAMGVMGRKRK